MDAGSNPLQDPLSALEVGYDFGRVTTDGSLEHTASWWLCSVPVLSELWLTRQIGIVNLGLLHLPPQGFPFLPQHNKQLSVMPPCVPFTRSLTPAEGAI